MAPTIHETSAAPDISGLIDLDGTEYGDQASTAPSGTPRGYRASSAGDAFGATEAHASTGQPDPRRGHATILPDPGAEVEHVDYRNEQAAVVLNHESPPDRPRQGFTGADPSRAATYRRPLVMRLFDKIMADHPGPVVKVEQAAPTAARPRHGLGDLTNAQPFAGGQTGTQAEGIGPTRNSFRILPEAWDALLVDIGGPAVSESTPDPGYTAAAGQAARGRFR